MADNWITVDGQNVFMTMCYKCKCLMALPEAIYRAAQMRRGSLEFFCPNGHGQVFSKGKTEAEKLREALDAERRSRERATQRAAMLEDEVRAAERSAAAYKGVATRMKNRVKHGVCPCCNRTFANLAAHMKNQHPEFDNVVDLAAKKA